jgi:hypothetical protein
LVGLCARTAHADTTVQIPFTGVLDARSVTTLTGGNLVVFTLPTDGGNLQNGFATKAVAMKQGQPPENALPDDGHFPADARHPEVVLNFSNTADAASPQTHLIKPAESITFPVPAATYSKLFLFFNGAAGGTTITITLTYADAMDVKMAKIPDYYNDPTDPTVFHLAPNLAKYDKTSKINEANHHNIDGVELAGMAGKTLNSVKIEHPQDGGNLVFWGATGIATSDVAVGGAGGSGGSGGMGGSGGSGGAAGAVTGGAAGASGATTAGTAGASAGSPGTSGAGGNGTAGMPATPGGTTFMAPSSPESDSGCGCRVVATPIENRPALWLALGVLGGLLGRRKQRRAA